MVEQLQSRLAKIGSKRSIHLIRKTLHIYSVVKKSQEKLCLPKCYTINISQVTEEILSPVCLFRLIFSVSSPPPLTTMRFPHSSLMNTSLGESSKFPMSSISMQSPRGKLPPVRVGVWVRVNFVVGGQFSSGAIVPEPFLNYKVLFRRVSFFQRNRNIFENNIKKTTTKANQIRWLVNWN